MGFVTAALVASVSLAAAGAGAATPLQVRIQGGVFGPSEFGLILLAEIPVAAADGASVTARSGIFSFTTTFPGFPLTVTARIDGVAMRTIATRFSSDAVITVNLDPSSEAAVQRLEAIGLERFTDDGIDAVIGAYLTANAANTFDGLEITQAIALARQTAQNSPEVHRTIDEVVIRPVNTCRGDCDGDGFVTVNELVTGVNIALGNRPPADCAANAPGTVIDVTFLVSGIRNALKGCSVD